LQQYTPAPPVPAGLDSSQVADKLGTLEGARCVDLMCAAAVATDPAHGNMPPRRAAQARPSLNDPARWLIC
jgi:hypothetical protein